MTNLNNYLQDGADIQSCAVLMITQGFDIKKSWCEKRNEYKAEIKVARWENCREQGYVLSMRNRENKEQLNIAFFTHRNSDSICAVKWNQTSINSLNIDTAVFCDVYKDKYDVSFEVGYNKFSQMSDWMKKEFNLFW